MRHSLLALILSFVLVGSAFSIDTGRAREIINIIASDAFEGRRPGSAGGTKTEEFLAENLRMIGVQPGGRGYFQEVPMLVTEEQAAELTLMDHELGKIPFVLGVDFNVVTHSGTGGIVAPAVIVGYGYVRPDKKRDDYGDLDVANKAVLIIRGKPDSPYDFDQDYSRRYTLKWAQERRAAAVLYYQDPFPTYGAAIPAEEYDPNLPIMYVGDRLFRLLLDGTGYSVETYLEKLKSAPLPIDTEKRVWVSTRTRKVTDRTPRNVLGIIYGTDPVLKNEIIVVGGHWDHIGKNAEGIVYNGADDNASGTALVAEIARAIVANPLKRSVLVAHFTGEEDGLLGSKYFVENPTIPFGNIVGMVNLDCEGMGSGRVVMAGGDLFGEAWTEYKSALDSTERSQILFYREDGYGGSDHESFMRGGCPVLAFWSRGDHPFYHHYEDDARWISDSVLTAIGSKAEEFIRFLGDRPGQIAFHADTARLEARYTVSLDFNGFTIDALGTVPELSAISLAWLPREAAITTSELMRRMAELRHHCDLRDVSASGLKDAITAERRQREALAIGMDDNDLFYRNPADVKMLAREGLSVIRLSPGTSAAERNARSAAMDAARDVGLFALIPFDFAASKRIELWKRHALVHTTLSDFAAAPESVREGLLTSDALLFLEITDSPAAEQLNTLIIGCERQVHISFGSLPFHRREEHARTIIKNLYAAGFSRDQVLLLTGGNLRRFFSRES